MSPVARRLRIALAASVVAGAFAACQGADAYYRNRPDGGGFVGAGGFGGTYSTSVAGSFGFAGTAGTTGAAGQTGAGGAAGAMGAAGGAAGGGGAAGSAGGGGSAGSAGTAGMKALTMPCTTCMVKVQYTCRSSDTGQASFVLDVTNESSVSFPLSSLTLRYWYTADASKQQELDCDFAKLGCTNLVTSADTNPGPTFMPVMPPKDKATEYAEIAFKAGAFALDPFLDTGEIQLRLHNKDFSTINQVDDYSFDAGNCSAMSPTAVEWPQITAYLDGVLVWGTEPGPPK